MQRRFTRAVGGDPRFAARRPRPALPIERGPRHDWGVAYELHGLVGRIEPVAHAAAELGLVPVELSRGFALLPGPEPDPDAEDLPAFDDLPLWWLDLDLEWAAVSASRVGPVAYVEAEFAQGAGSQAAVVWADGLIVLGPLREDDAEHARRRVSLVDWPVNRALRRLEVPAETGADEFDTLGLGRYRDTDAWREAAASPPPV